MREAKCSLLLQDDVPYNARIKSLPKQRVLVFQDRGGLHQSGSIGSQPHHPKALLPHHVPQHTPASPEENFYVDFKGATIFQLEPTPQQAHSCMPVTITVGGRCVFTPENYQDFRVMMRTKEQSVEMDITPNGSFDWPDVSSLLLCPVCGERGQIPRDANTDVGENDINLQEYWMIFYPLLQVCVLKGSQLTLGTRTICRLVCMDCMEDLLEGVTLTVQPGGGGGAGGVARTPTAGRRSTRLAFTLPARDVLAEAGSASFLEDGPPRPDTHPHLDDILDAWTLYNLWEHSGAWEALQNDYRIVLSRSMHGDPSGHGFGIDDDEAEPCRLKERMGKPCGNPTCNKVHGRIDAGQEQVVRLAIKCQHCQSEFYCSKACRDAAEPSHREECERKQKDREERREKKAKKVECDTCHQKFPHTKMKKCSRCRHATYCSPECQKLAWDAGHKSECQQIPR
jgi:MYND finger